LARRFAPQLRYNAWAALKDPLAASSLQNANEDFLPLGVDAFFDALAAGRAEIVVARSRSAAPARVRAVPTRGVPRFHGGFLHEVPERMAGAEPNAAPTYVNAYRAPELEEQPDVRVYFISYWQFYGYDWACSRVLGSFGCIGAHRGDWEHQAFRIHARLDPQGKVEQATLVTGYFYAHGWGVAVPGDRLERVDDRGLEGGEHPVVYVSLGKHGSYPEPGELHDFPVHRAIADQDDFFHGNGVRIACWKTPLIDIGKPTRAAHPERFASPAFRKILGQSPGAEFETWLDYTGRWGSDLEGIGSLIWTSSPTGPYQKVSFANRGRESVAYATWKKRFGDRLRLDRARGLALPRVESAAPTRK
jgi:hypothetical protein